MREKLNFIERESRRLEMENGALKEKLEVGVKLDDSDTVVKKDELLRLEGTLNNKKRELKNLEEMLQREQMEKQLFQQTIQNLKEQQGEDRKHQAELIQTINQRMKTQGDEEVENHLRKQLED